MTFACPWGGDWSAAQPAFTGFLDQPRWPQDIALYSAVTNGVCLVRPCACTAESGQVCRQSLASYTMPCVLGMLCCEMGEQRHVKRALKLMLPWPARAVLEGGRNARCQQLYGVGGRQTARSCCRCPGGIQAARQCSRRALGGLRGASHGEAVGGMSVHVICYLFELARR